MPRVDVDADTLFTDRDALLSRDSRLAGIRLSNRHSITRILRMIAVSPALDWTSVKHGLEIRSGPFCARDDR